MNFEECYKLIQPEINNKFPYREGKRTFTEIFEGKEASESLKESSYEKLYEAYAVDEKVLVPLTEQEAIYLIGQLEEGQEISDIDMQRLSEAFHPVGWMANTFAPNSAAAHAYRQAKSAKDSIKRQYKQAKKQNKINQYLDNYYKDDLKNKYAQAQQQITQKQIPLSNEMQNLLKPGRIQAHSMGKEAVNPTFGIEFPEYPKEQPATQSVVQPIVQQPVVTQTPPVEQKTQFVQPQSVVSQKPQEKLVQDPVNTAVEQAKKVSTNTIEKKAKPTKTIEKSKVATPKKSEEIHLPESVNIVPQKQTSVDINDSYVKDFLTLMAAANV